jgi:hypothetical protein
MAEITQLRLELKLFSFSLACFCNLLFEPHDLT